MHKWMSLGIIFLGVLCDQSVKHYCLQYYDWGQVIPVFPGFNLTLSINTGVAFGWYADLTGWGRLLGYVFLMGILISLIILGVRSTSWTRMEQVGWMALLAGGVSNLSDRYFYGGVIDYLDFYYKNWHYWTFNLADSFIFIGAVCWFLASYQTAKEKRHA